MYLILLSLAHSYIPLSAEAAGGPGNAKHGHADGEGGGTYGPGESSGGGYGPHPLRHQQRHRLEPLFQGKNKASYFFFILFYAVFCCHVFFVCLVEWRTTDLIRFDFKRVLLFFMFCVWTIVFSAVYVWIIFFLVGWLLKGSFFGKSLRTIIMERFAFETQLF